MSLRYPFLLALKGKPGNPKPFCGGSPIGKDRPVAVGVKGWHRIECPKSCLMTLLVGFIWRFTYLYAAVTMTFWFLACT